MTQTSEQIELASQSQPCGAHSGAATKAGDSAAFALDTSGSVSAISLQGLDGTSRYEAETYGKRYCWSELTPFAQGYVEALFADLADAPRSFWDSCFPRGEHAFSDLSPEALAMILADCERGRSIYAKARQDDGRHFWRWRQVEGARYGFPPLTVYLDDAGNVCLRERGQ